MNFNTNYSWLGMSTNTASKSTFNYEGIIQAALKRDQKPIQGLKARSTELQSRLDTMASLKGIAASLLSSTNKLNFSHTGTGLTKIRSIDSSIATRGTFTTGSYGVKVQQLAQRHTIASSEFSTKNGLLSKDGRITLNGKEVKLQATDNIAEIATKINEAGAGVKARFIESDGKFSLQIANEKTGAASQISLVDTDGLAGELGFVAAQAKGGPTGQSMTATATTTVPNLTEDTKLSAIFRDTAKVNNLYSPTNLNELAASVEASYGLMGNRTTVKVGSSETYTGYSSAKEMMEAIIKDQTGHDYEYTRVKAGQYTFTAKAPTAVATSAQSSSTTSPDTDDDAADFLNVVSEGQDAIVEVNGQLMTSADNGFSFGGAQARFSKTGDFSFDVVADPFEVTGSVSTVSDFASSYNALVDMVNKNSKYDSSKGKDGDLYGDQQVAGLVSSIRKAIEDGTGTNLSTVGITFDAEGRMSVDQNKLKSALDGDNVALSNIFGTGSGTGATKLEQVLEGATKAGTGGLSALQEASQRELDSVKSELAAAQSKVEKKETMLRKKFKMIDDFRQRAESQQSQMASLLGASTAMTTESQGEGNMFTGFESDKNKNSSIGQPSSSNFTMWG